MRFPPRSRGLLLLPFLAIFLTCTYSRAQSTGRQRTYPAGWNLIAAPPGTDLSAASALYAWQADAGSYASVAPGATGAGAGYWAYFAADTTVTLSAGAARDAVSVQAPAGAYVLIGNPSGNAPASVSGADVLYTYTPAAGYQLAGQRAPLPGGSGAWALSGAGGRITLIPGAGASHPSPEAAARGYPLHTNIVATVFWVGEIFDVNAADGSQVVSAYDDAWEQHFGGCDGSTASGSCQTVSTNAADGYFPAQMTPRENPFYLDLPYADFDGDRPKPKRTNVIPWAAGLPDPGPGVSLMKNRWVKLMRGGHTCYGQIEDAGPGQYDDTAYVFGANDARPRNKKFNGAGMDVSPALRDCLGFNGLDNDENRLDWQFVDDGSVPDGPWRRLVTTSQVYHP
ncbi:MAG TPA: hypothetical protein VKV26_18860 [Dehalococcoidia bacterium]|nr:hypothetical protein [Dehalococcoidia bacterium]